MPDQQPVRERKNPGQDRDDDQVMRRAVGEPLRRRLRFLCALHELDDPRERGIRSDLRRPKTDRAGEIHGACDHRCAGFLLDRHRLAGDHRFVDRGASVDDHAIDRRTVACAQHHHIAHADFRHQDTHDPTVAFDVGLTRGELEELAHRIR